VIRIITRNIDSREEEPEQNAEEHHAEQLVVGGSVDDVGRHDA
jgi:hypothetical protein